MNGDGVPVRLRREVNHRVVKALQTVRCARSVVMLALMLLPACKTSPVPVASAAIPVEAAEPPHVRSLRQVHQAQRYIPALLAADLVAPDLGWWAAGDSTRLPWAGSRSGVAGIEEFSRLLGQHMRYTSFAMRQYVVAPEQVAVVIDAAGISRLTGKPFASPVLRLYDFRDGRIVRVRSFYDTDAYARALDVTADMEDRGGFVTRSEGAVISSTASSVDGAYMLRSLADSAIVRYDFHLSEENARRSGGEVFRYVAHSRGRAVRPTHAVVAEWKVDSPARAAAFERSRRELFALRAEHLTSFHADFLLRSTDDSTRYLVLGLYAGEEGLQQARGDPRIAAFLQTNPASRFGARESSALRTFGVAMR